MALINCPECGKEISDQARNCINCGYPINVKQSTNKMQGVIKKIVDSKRILIVVVVTIVLLFIVISVLGRSQLYGKWYYVDDDDFWMDIDNNTISVCSVMTDEIYGTIEYDYNKETQVIKTGDVIFKGDAESELDYDRIKRIARKFDNSIMYVEGTVLHVIIGDDDIRFSSDKKYKRDH